MGTTCVLRAFQAVTTALLPKVMMTILLVSDATKWNDTLLWGLSYHMYSLTWCNIGLGGRSSCLVTIIWQWFSSSELRQHQHRRNEWIAWLVGNLPRHVVVNWHLYQDHHVLFAFLDEGWHNKSSSWPSKSTDGVIDTVASCGSCSNYSTVPLLVEAQIVCKIDIVSSFLMMWWAR